MKEKQNVTCKKQKFVSDSTAEKHYCYIPSVMFMCIYHFICFSFPFSHAQKSEFTC